MYYSYTYGAASASGYAYPLTTYVAETRDQFIRRYVLERTKDIGSYHIEFINEARNLWDESIKTEKK